jgi:hypothetical protein
VRRKQPDQDRSARTRIYENVHVLLTVAVTGVVFGDFLELAKKKEICLSAMLVLWTVGN